ncbi:MAG TPA: hypothetical protein VIC28_05075, partial [Thermoanaerobaculia bacterium]
MAQVIGGHSLPKAITEPLAQLQGAPVLADGAVEIMEVEAQPPESVPDEGFEGRLAGDQGLGPGERPEGRFV